MISHVVLTAAGVWLVVLSLASQCHCEVIGIYDARKLRAERPRLEKRTNELWHLMYDNLLTADEQYSLRDARLRFPTMSRDGSPLNFHAVHSERAVYMPIHSLLLLEDICTAYAWLYHHGYSAITINEYAAMLKYRQPTAFPGARFPLPMSALGVPENALDDATVNQLSLRFRNSAYAYVLGHEMGHILHRHPGNQAVAANVSRTHEREADEFALRLLRRDKQIPMGAILFFQMTAFTASPGRFDFPTVEAWQRALRDATHPVTSSRVRGAAAALQDSARQYGPNREAALYVADKLDRIAQEMDDRDWQLYFRSIGQSAPLSRLLPRKE